MLFHYFDRILAEYEHRFEREYGVFRPIIKKVVERHLDCGNPRCGFARLRRPDSGNGHLLMFSCRTRGFCPSCHDDSRLASLFAREVLTDFVQNELLSPEWATGCMPMPIGGRSKRPIPSKGWAEMIRKVYEVDPMVCPQCVATMKVIAFLTDYAVDDRIINHLKLTFVAERPPPPHIAYQEVLVAAETAAEFFP